MKLDFEGYQLTHIVNPNAHCTEVHFASNDNPDLTEKTVIFFDTHVKCIEVEEHQKYKRVKVYLVGEEASIDIDFSQENTELFELFLKSLYNK